MSLQIARLSVDIFADIFDVVNSPRDMVSLACTCSALNHLTRAAISRHRHAFESFRYASDRDPSTILSLVRHLVLRSDPVVGKYFRSFDIWGARLSWDEWRRIEVSEQGVKLADEEPATVLDRLTSSEIEQLLEIARQVVGDSELGSAREELENGGDGLLNLLIIASAPRLESLTFVRRDDLLHKSCQAWLYKAIQWQLTLQKGWEPFSGFQWPQGLCSLRRLAVGVDAGVADENIEAVDEELRSAWEGYRECAAMMRLPSLTSLYYHTGSFPDEDEWGSDEEEVDDDEDSEGAASGAHGGGGGVDTNAKPELPKRSSTVTQLYLDKVRGEYTQMSGFYRKLIAMPRALQSFALRWVDGEFDPGDVLGALNAYQGDSLQKMMFYNPGSMVGYRCSAYRPESVPDAPLTMWWQCVEDVELQALYDREEGQATRKDVVEVFRRWVARDQAEVIILEAELSGHHIDDSAMKWSYYEGGLLALLQEIGRKGLKAMFIDFPKEPDSDGDLESPDGFAKVVRLAEEMGVDLYGSKHIKAPKRHAIDFPIAPSKWDIATGPYFGKRVEEGFVSYDCVGGNWSKPERDLYAWHYIPPTTGS